MTLELCSTIILIHLPYGPCEQFDCGFLHRWQEWIQTPLVLLHHLVWIFLPQTDDDRIKGRAYFLLNSLESSCFLFDNGLSIPCLPTSMLLSIAQMCYRYHCVCQKGTILPDSIGLVQAQNCQVDLAHSDCIPVELNRSKNPTHTLLLLAKPCIK